MSTGKRSPAKDVMAKQRQRKLATALRTNLRRRKDQARERVDDVSADGSVVPLSDEPIDETEPHG